MTKPTGKPVGRPPKRGATSTKTLGSVRITEEQLTDYDRAASLEGVTRTDWVTNTLDKAAARILKKHGDQV